MGVHVEQDDLEEGLPDIVAGTLRGLVGGIPVIGGLLAEVVCKVIPRQRHDRMADMLRNLALRVAESEQQRERLAQHLRTPEGSELLELGVTQAAHARTKERRHALASMLADRLGSQDMRYAESKKILTTLGQLTDEELLVVYYHSRPGWLGSPWHVDLERKYPQVLMQQTPINAPIEFQQQGNALQASYVDTLIGLGILRERREGLGLTEFGQLFFRAIAPDERFVGA